MVLVGFIFLQSLTYRLGQLQHEVVVSCTSVFLDGKLYVLGGRAHRASTEVDMLDLAGLRQWKQCASMANARTYCGCGVKGGWGPRQPMYLSEVYDPENDAWSPISRSMHDGYIRQKVTIVGDELFVHSGRRFNSGGLREYASHAEVYHPLKDNWRIVENFTGNGPGGNALTEGIVLTVKGKLHKLTRLGIQVFDVRASSWNPMRPFSSGESKPNPPFEIYPNNAVTVGDEVLASVRWRDTGEGYCSGRFYVRSQGVDLVRTKKSSGRKHHALFLPIWILCRGVSFSFKLQLKLWP